MFINIASNLKQTRDFPTVNNLFTLFLNTKTKDKLINIYIYKKEKVFIYKIIILFEKLYLLNIYHI